jgi:hypothetical protein
MNIFFRDKKYQKEINCSFFVNSLEDSTASLKSYFVGDRVTILSQILVEQAEAINNLKISEMRASNLHGDDWHIDMPFRVVQRTHGLSFQGERGTLQELGLSLVLEAETGLWEDIFLWLCCGQQPEWTDV